MKTYVSGEKFAERYRLDKFDLVYDYSDADTLVIAPGGLSSIIDIAKGLMDGKDIYIYNKELFYAPIIEQIYKMKKEDGSSLCEDLTIERDLDDLIKKLEEKENGKTNNGKTR